MGKTYKTDAVIAEEWKQEVMLIDDHDLGSSKIGRKRSIPVIGAGGVADSCKRLRSSCWADAVQVICRC